jgi:hypothetical protein
MFEQASEAPFHAFSYVGSGDGGATGGSGGASGLGGGGGCGYKRVERLNENDNQSV